jgi:hypothetical protein
MPDTIEREPVNLERRHWQVLKDTDVEVAKEQARRRRRARRLRRGRHVDLGAPRRALAVRDPPESIAVDPYGRDRPSA